MSSGGRESPPDCESGGERSGCRRDRKHSLKGSVLPSMIPPSSDGATSERRAPFFDLQTLKETFVDITETQSRSLTPEIPKLDATFSVPSAHDDPLPFPPLSLTRGTWQNLSIIFEGSESTNSVSNEDAKPTKSVTSTLSSIQGDHCAKTKQKNRYSLPSISSLASKSTESTKTNVADKIAYFEESLREGKPASTSSPRLKSFVPVFHESRRRSLPAVLNKPSLASSVSVPARPERSDESNLGTKLYKGFLWYLNVHGPGPPKWILCNASLYQTALVLTWRTSSATKATVNLDLLHCLDVESTPTVSDPSIASDVGAIAWIWDIKRTPSSVEDIYPMHLQFDDGVERIATSTLIDRVTWVGIILEYLPLNPSRRDPVPSPRARVLSPIPDSNSTVTISSVQGSQNIAMSFPTTLSPNLLRPTNGHHRTRSTGDVPKIPKIHKETQRMPLIRRISSMSNIRSTGSAASSEFGYGYVTPNESSTISSSPSRNRSFSLKSVTSFLSGRSSRLDNLSSTDGSEPAAPISLAPTRSRTLLHSRSNSRDSTSVASEDSEGNSLGRLFRKYDASALTRFKKPKPRLPAFLRLTIDPYRSFSDGQVPSMPEVTLSASSTIQNLGDYSRSPTYHSAMASLPSTPPYYTASEGDVREDEPHESFMHRNGPAPASESLFVTASEFTSSDAWMAHFSAASRPTSPRAPSSRRRRHAKASTPGAISPGLSFSHLFDVESVALPAHTVDKAGSLVFVEVNVGSTGFTAQETALSTDAILGDLITRASAGESSIILVDAISSEMANESFGHPHVPPPSPQSPPRTQIGEINSTPRTVSTLGVAATRNPSTDASPPHSPNQTPENGISTQIDITNSVQEVTQPIQFASVRNGDVEYEISLQQSTSPSLPSVFHVSSPFLLSQVPSWRRLSPKRVVSRQRSDSSLNSSIFLPSREPSIRTMAPKTPSLVEVSLTPVQASIFLSTLDTVTSSSAQGSRVHGLGQADNSCERRLRHLQEFVERTRAAQTEISAEFSEQLSRIEGQLAQLGQLIRERISSTWMATGGNNLKDTGRQEAWARSISLPHQPNAPHPPTVICLPPPPSTLYDETQRTSIEFQATAAQSDTSGDISIHLTLGHEPPAHITTGDISSSLHLSRFPEVPNGPTRGLLTISNAMPRDVSTTELRDIIERLSGSIEALVARQQAFNGALESLRNRGVALESPVSPRWTELLQLLERFAQRQDDNRVHGGNVGYHHLLDPASSRASPSSVEGAQILQALPVPTGTISLCYARKIQNPHGRSRSSIAARTSNEGSLPPGAYNFRPRARSLGLIVTMADEPLSEGAAEANSVVLSEHEVLGPLIGVPHDPIKNASITRTWYRKPRGKQMHVHWDTPEATMGNLMDPSPQGDTGIDSGGPEVTRLLQESRIRQEAASTQQDEIVRYLGELNAWLSRDAIDRRAELRGLGDRLDGIQSTLMYGAVPAISLTVPPRRVPFFAAISDQSDDHSSWPVEHVDEDPIIPPTPPNPQQKLATVPSKLVHKKHETDDDPPIISLPTAGRSHTRGEEDTRAVENPSNETTISNSHCSAGPRVTFATPGQEWPAMPDSRGRNASVPSTIRVSGDVTAFRPTTRSFTISRDSEADTGAPQAPTKDRRTSRSPTVKPLTPETTGIIVNTRVNSRGKSSATLRSSDHVPLFDTNIETHMHHHHPISTILPSNHRSEGQRIGSPVMGHHAKTNNGSHIIPQTVITSSKPHFREGRDDQDRDTFIQRPISSPLNCRHGSRNRRYPDNSTARRASTSSERVTRRGSHYHETPIGRRSSSSPEPSRRQGDYNPRSKRPNSPRYQTIPPYYRHSSHQDVNPMIVSPLPVHRTRPLPPILTEPAVDIQCSQGQVPGQPRSPTIPYLPRHGDPSETRMPTVPHQGFLPNNPPEIREGELPVIAKDGPTKSYHPITSSGSTHFSVSPMSQRRVHEVTSPRRSLPSGSNVAQTRASKPQGARGKGATQIQTTQFPSVDLASRPGAPTNDVASSRRRPLSTVCVAETHLNRSHATGTRDSGAKLDIQSPPGNSRAKQGDKRMKSAEKRLSAISEKSERQLPSRSSSNMIGESDHDQARSDSDYSEQARDAVFLARLAERRRTIEEEARAQSLAHENILLALEDPDPTKSTGIDPGKRPHISLLKRHIREAAFTSPASTRTEFVTSQQGGYGHITAAKSHPETAPATAMYEASDTTLYRPVGIIADGDPNGVHMQSASQIFSPSSRVTEDMQSDQSCRLIHSMMNDSNIAAPPNDPYSLELANERAKARRLEEEIQKTKDAIQTIKNERAAANEKRRLDTLASISQIQDDMRSKIRSITNQLTQLKGNDSSNAAREESPTSLLEDGIRGLVHRIHDGKLAERHMREGGRIVESQSALTRDMEQLRQRNEAQKVLIEEMLGQTMKDNRCQQALLFEAFKAASTEQVKASVNEHLQQFNHSVTHEVRILLSEVGNLREQRRNLQHEIGCLLCFRSKMEPGGEFDASWDPAHGPPCTHFPPPGADSIPRPDAPGFVGSAPTVGTTAPVAPTTRRPTAGSRNAASVHPTVTSPPPAYAVPRPLCGLPRATKATTSQVAGTSKANRESTASCPPPGRPARKSRPKRPE